MMRIVAPVTASARHAAIARLLAMACAGSLLVLPTRGLGAFDLGSCLADDVSALDVQTISGIDVDGDGTVDLSARVGSGGVRVFYGPEGSTSRTPTSDELSAFVWVDVDADGDVDLVGATPDRPSQVRWYANPGTRSDDWTASSIGSAVGVVEDLAVGDLDATGALDVIGFADGGTFRWSSFTGSSWPRSTIESDGAPGPRGWIADADLDGDLDVGRGDSWWRNDGGAFARIDVPGPLGSDSRAWARHVDHEGRIDFFAADPAQCGVLVRLEANPGTGIELRSTRTDTDLAVVESVVTFDVDRDGDRDLVVAGRTCGDTPRTILLRNTGTSFGGWTLTEIGPYAFATPLDVDGDGAMDLGLATSTGACRIVLAINDDPDGLALDAWQRHVIDTDRPWRAIFVDDADIDRDGDLDVVAGAWWYENPGNLSGSWTRRAVGSPMNNALIVADLDHDGDVDVLGTENAGADDASDLVWASNDGQGGFTIVSGIASGGGDFPQGRAVARFTADPVGGRRPESVAISWHDDAPGIQELVVPPNPLTDPWTSRLLTSFSQDEQLQVGDVDRDGDLDLTTGTAWLENDAGTWTTRSFATSSSPPDRHALVDMDRDGRLDVVVGVEAIGSSGPVTSYLQPSSPVDPWPADPIAELTGPMSLDAADLDLDGDLDVVVGEHTSGDIGSGRLVVLENGGDGTWTERLVYRGDEHHDGAHLADLDGDGDLDVVSVGWFHDRVVVYENLAVSGTATSVDDEATLAEGRSLIEGIGPTPFSAQVAIRLATARAQQVDLGVYDARGRRIASLSARESLSPGTHEFTWDGRDRDGQAVASGLYFVRAVTSERTDVRKIVLTR